MSIAENLTVLKKQIPSHVELIVVSKTHSVSSIMEAYQAGQRKFGENKVQEMVAKYEQLPKDIEWHLIGHLQTNKVKNIVPFVALIHSVDSMKLLKTINRESEKCNRTTHCLLQIHIAKEETKFGLSFEEAGQLLMAENLAELNNVMITGLMGMATATDDETVIQNEFRSLSLFFRHQKTLNPNLQILSMGMSGDYHSAIKEGSNMLRVGSVIFGQRPLTAHVLQS